MEKPELKSHAPVVEAQKRKDSIQAQKEREEGERAGSRRESTQLQQYNRRESSSLSRVPLLLLSTLCANSSCFAVQICVSLSPLIHLCLI